MKDGNIAGDYALALIWKAVAFFEEHQETSGADHSETAVYISAALMEAAVSISLIRGMNEHTFCELARTHFRDTKALLEQARKMAN
jgi:hypothetical protein